MPAEQRDLDARMLAAAYARLPLSLALNVAVVALFYATLSVQFDPVRMRLWALLGAVLIALRAADLLAYRRRGAEAVQHWQRRFMLSAAASGLGWALGPLLLIQGADRPQSYLLVLTLAGVGAVATATMATQLRGLLTLLVCALLPTAWALWRTGGAADQLAAYVMLACLVAQALAGRTLHRALRLQLGTEAALAEREREFRALVDHLPGTVYRMRADGSAAVQVLSEHHRELTGDAAADVLAAQGSLHQRVLPADLPVLQSAQALALQERRSFELRYRLRHADGSVRWVVDRGRGVYDDRGQAQHVDGLLFDRTEAERNAQELERTRRQLLDAVQAMDAGVLMFDAEDRLILCNDSYRRSLGPGAPPLEPGATLHEVLRAVYHHGLGVHKPAEGEAAWIARRRAEHLALDAGPRVRELQVDGRWYRCDDSRSDSGVTISMLTDISASRQLLSDLQAARDAAESASRAKSRFLANMSHELRTPLNAVIGAAQLMKAEAHDAEQRLQLVDAIQRSGANLLSLIESILDLSRIEAGELGLQRHDFHLLECTESALATAGVEARAKGLQLACVVAPGLAPWRRGDEARLRQVLINLLGNALKFTHQGEVVLRVDAAGDAVRIEVADTGIGIAPEAQQGIFEPFRQADEGADRRYGGSGLGLAIVRQLVQAMGGSIALASTPGQGSCFALQLPMPVVAAPPPEPPPLGLRVAFVEPQEASAQALQGLLQRLGCEATRCTGPVALQAWARRHEGDDEAWLLIDVDRCPAEDWLEPLAPWLDPQRVVGMTAAEDPGNDALRQRLRLPRQLVRPLSRSALISRLRPTLSAASRPMPLAPLSQPELQAMPQVLLVEDDRLNQTIVARLLGHAGYRVLTADDGQSALASLRRQPVDLVLMDWQMPDIDGLEVTRRIRAGLAGEAARGLPIVALTANAFAEDRAACEAAGMNDFLSKPVNAVSLVQTVRRWLGRAADRADGAQRRGAPSAATPPVTQVFDPGVLAALPMVADGSEPDYRREVLAMFADDTPGLLRGIAQAREAQDAPTLLRLVHTLKSSAAAVGALSLAACAAQAEALLRGGAAPSAMATEPFWAEWHALESQVRPLLADNPEAADPS